MPQNLTLKKPGRGWINPCHASNIRHFELVDLRSVKPSSNFHLWYLKTLKNMKLLVVQKEENPAKLQVVWSIFRHLLFLESRLTSHVDLTNFFTYLVYRCPSFYLVLFQKCWCQRSNFNTQNFSSYFEDDVDWVWFLWIWRFWIFEKWKISTYKFRMKFTSFKFCLVLTVEVSVLR